MASALTPGTNGSSPRSDDPDRTRRPTDDHSVRHDHDHDHAHDDAWRPDLASIRPLPPETLGERLGRWWSAADPRPRWGGGRRDPLPFPEMALEDSVGPVPRRAVGRPVAWCCLVVVAGAVTWWLVRPPAPPVETVLPMAGAPTVAGDADPGAGGAGGDVAATAGTATVDGSTTPTDGEAPGGPGHGVEAAPELVVQAAGAVRVPGVYRLPGGSRVDDLVRAAGGLTPEADVDRVNLASQLGDGERVWVPRHGDAEVPSVVAGTGGGAAGAPPGGDAGGAASAEPAVVDLNTATAEQLDTLPGVGPATAASILAFRSENGRFTSVDELLDVRGIGEAKLEQIRPLVRV